MAYLVKADFKTHAYDDVIDLITRADGTIVTEAIATAIDEAKTYLMRYDLDALFGVGETAATIADANLKSKVKDLAIWHLIRLCNANIDLKMARTAYEDAIQFFKDVMKANRANTSWMIKADDAKTDYPEGHVVTATYNTKKSQRW